MNMKAAIRLRALESYRFDKYCKKYRCFTIMCHYCLKCTAYRINTCQLHGIEEWDHDESAENNPNALAYSLHKYFNSKGIDLSRITLAEKMKK